MEQEKINNNQNVKKIKNHYFTSSETERTKGMEIESGDGGGRGTVGCSFVFSIVICF